MKLKIEEIYRLDENKMMLTEFTPDVNFEYNENNEIIKLVPISDSEYCKYAEALQAQYISNFNKSILILNIQDLYNKYIKMIDVINRRGGSFSNDNLCYTIESADLEMESININIIEYLGKVKMNLSDFKLYMETLLPYAIIDDSNMVILFDRYMSYLDSLKDKNVMIMDIVELGFPIKDLINFVNSAVKSLSIPNDFNMFIHDCEHSDINGSAWTKQFEDIMLSNKFNPKYIKIALSMSDQYLVYRYNYIKNVLNDQENIKVSNDDKNIFVLEISEPIVTDGYNGERKISSIQSLKSLSNL